VFDIKLPRGLAPHLNIPTTNEQNGLNSRNKSKKEYNRYSYKPCRDLRYNGTGAVFICQYLLNHGS
jgi:hypothetical protein